MIRLLIVDNERPIVDSLIDLFAPGGKPELETYAAYSAAEALEWLGRTKIDIVLSDIRMPGMDGLELQREIVKQWPSCKVVFLTGYDDFEYIQQGMRNGGVDYLLKTESPDEILRAVNKAAEELYEAVEAERLVLLAENQMRRAMPLLLNEYMLEMIHGDPESMRRRGERFAEWQVPLEADGDVMLVIGRVDDWRDELGAADKQLMLFAIRNIAEEFLAKSTRCVSVIWEKKQADVVYSASRTAYFGRVERTIEPLRPRDDRVDPDCLQAAPEARRVVRFGRRYRALDARAGDVPRLETSARSGTRFRQGADSHRSAGLRAPSTGSRTPDPRNSQPP